MNETKGSVLARVHIPGATREDVWTTVTQIDNWATMITAIDSIQVVNANGIGDVDVDTKDLDTTTARATTTPFVVGTSWDETRTMFGRSETERMTLSQVDHDQYYYAIHSVSCGASMTFHHYIVDAAAAKKENTASTGDADATTVSGCDLVMTYEYKSLTWTAWLMSWMAYLMMPTMRSAVARDLQDIQSAVSATKKGDGPGSS